jgi:hypothetical protein
MNWEDFIRKCLRVDYEESDNEEIDRYTAHPYLARHLAAWWRHIETIKRRLARDGIDENNPYPKKKD